MNAIGASILIVLIVVAMVSSRRYALIAMLAGVLYLTQSVAIDLLGFNMFAIRFLEIACFLRVMARREFRLSSLNGIDRLFLLLYSYTTIIFLMRSSANQAFAIGVAVDSLFCYFAFRGLITDMDDFRWFLRATVVLLIPFVCLLFIEMRTGQNPFSLLGAVLPNMIREDRVRCIGSLRHPSLMGSLGGSLLPLYIGLGLSRNDRLYAIVGILLCLAIVWFSNSGGPTTFAVVGVLGWLLWFYRHRMRTFRRTVVIGLIGLALIMKAPVWYLPTHFSFGGDAWHRSYLVDVAVRHLHEWWLWGMPVSNTSKWFAYQFNVGAGEQADITNQFISFGLNAGLMAIVLFVWLLARTYQSLGRKLETVRWASTTPSETEHLLWGLGVMLAGHISNFFAICYFDQFYVIWFMQLALISNLAHESACSFASTAITIPGLPSNSYHTR